MTLEEKLAKIRAGVREPRRQDGFLLEEYEAIIREIEKNEGAAFDVYAIWVNGIDRTYPDLKLRYPYVWEE